jgi:hypothetical protein
LSPAGLPAGLSGVDAVVAVASLLIIVPSYVNQLAISLASPLTVRVVLAMAPALIFLLQLVEGRLSASPYSLTATMLYAIVAMSAGFARQHAIRSALLKQARVVQGPCGDSRSEPGGLAMNVPAEINVLSTLATRGLSRALAKVRTLVATAPLQLILQPLHCGQRSLAVSGHATYTVVAVFAEQQPF